MRLYPKKSKKSNLSKPKVYIAGAMLGKFLYNRPLFYLWHLKLKLKGYRVMNPAILSLDFNHHEYMRLSYTMINVCDEILLLRGCEKSIGAILEHQYGSLKNKKLILQHEFKSVHEQYRKSDVK